MSVETALWVPVKTALWMSVKTALWMFLQGNDGCEDCTKHDSTCVRDDVQCTMDVTPASGTALSMRVIVFLRHAMNRRSAFTKDLKRALGTTFCV